LLCAHASDAILFSLQPFSLETAGTTGVVEIQDKEKSYKKKRIQFELGVDIDFAPGKV
jgi:hypothetical protein